MTTLLTSELIDRIHSAARAKGFWDDAEPSAKRFLMLTVSELGECLEADRNAFRADLRDLEIQAASDPKAQPDVRAQIEAKAFRDNIKDTVEDELADAYIRICDIVGGFEVGVERVLRSLKSWHPMLADDLAGCPFEVTQLLVNLSSGGHISSLNIGEALAYLEHVAAREGIDLATHIDLKLRYNATRSRLHGKAY